MATDRENQGAKSPGVPGGAPTDQFALVKLVILATASHYRWLAYKYFGRSDVSHGPER
ncbi:MAG: hypothetical protein ABJB10_01330 [Mesorhizobium sp.]